MRFLKKKLLKGHHMEGRIRWSWKIRRAEEVKDKQRLIFILPVCGDWSHMFDGFPILGRFIKEANARFEGTCTLSCLAIWRLLPTPKFCDLFIYFFFSVVASPLVLSIWMCPELYSGTVLKNTVSLFFSWLPVIPLTLSFIPLSRVFSVELLQRTIYLLSDSLHNALLSARYK